MDTSCPSPRTNRTRTHLLGRGGLRELLDDVRRDLPERYGRRVRVADAREARLADAIAERGALHGRDWGEEGVSWSRLGRGGTPCVVAIKKADTQAKRAPHGAERHLKLSPLHVSVTTTAESTVTLRD